ncbi:hypothetical protein HanIR_Chr09g0392451 [Helianthus annuus]|nr:hypothetical protein HanIR_Chr09g0392451 [Helianthus annuus]
MMGGGGETPRTFRSVVLCMYVSYRTFLVYTFLTPRFYKKKKFTYIEFLGPVTTDPPVENFKLRHWS